MTVDDPSTAKAMSMMQAALALLDLAGEREAAAKLQEAVSTLAREPLPNTIDEVDGVLGDSERP